MVAIALFCLSNPYRFWKIKNNNNTSGADTSRFLIWRHPKKKKVSNKGNNKITELRTILQRESQNS
jgi:hypothetical protein